jgi:hypothetical protein
LIENIKDTGKAKILVTLLAGLF